jgi:hypothetical protein
VGFHLILGYRGQPGFADGTPQTEVCATCASNLANIVLGMQARKPATHCVQLFFPKRLFDARKHFILFQPHMVVKKFSKSAHFLGINRNLRRQPLLEVPHGAANLGVIGENSHNLSVLVKPRVPRIRRQQHFLLFAKMHVPRLVPEPDKLLRLPLDCRGPFLRRRLRRAPHLQRLNQREVVVLAKWVQTRMAFHFSTVFFVTPME